MENTETSRSSCDSSRRDSSLRKLLSLRNMLGEDTLRATKSISIRVRSPSGQMKSMRGDSLFTAPKSLSVQRGTTVVVIPSEYRASDRRDIEYFYDFDEIEDEIGRGEFGVVYKCTKCDDD